MPRMPATPPSASQPVTPGLCERHRHQPLHWRPRVGQLDSGELVSLLCAQNHGLFAPSDIGNITPITVQDTSGAHWSSHRGRGGNIVRFRVRVHVIGPISVGASIGTRRRRRRRVVTTRRPGPAAYSRPVPVTRSSDTRRKVFLWAAVFVAGSVAAVLFGHSSGTVSTPAVTTPQPVTVADCTAAFETQIQYSEAQTGRADMTTPAQCGGLTASQVRLAMSYAREATVP
jgi:hypothetical protein